MNIQSIPSTLYNVNDTRSNANDFSNDLPNSSKFFCILGFVSADDKDVEFRTDGTYSYHVTGKDISTGKEMTDAEKWEAITSQYSGRVITYKDFQQMLMNMCASGLITLHESAIIDAHASSVMESKKADYEQLGIYDIIEPLYSFIRVNFEELLLDLSDDDRVYLCDETNDPRPFLKTFYTKMISMLSGCEITI